jgi:hypothetical protein
MRSHATISGAELLLSVIAIRLAVLVVVGWSLTLLPRQVRDSKTACIAPAVASGQSQSARTVSPPVVKATLDDMRLHD